MTTTMAHIFAAERKRQGLSLRDAGKIIGVGFASLGRFERGDGDSSEMLRHKVSKWLATGEGSPATMRHPRELSFFLRLEQRVQLLEDRIARLENT